uniref:hypothetical protein n=1 Tax=Trichocoleus desertorum TaxID=1481672 RepID=UPI0025B5C7E6|nr:hypothetical protein [Trichocoleus desertorum]
MTMKKRWKDGIIRAYELSVSLEEEAQDLKKMLELYKWWRDGWLNIVQKADCIATELSTELSNLDSLMLEYEAWRTTADSGKGAPYALTDFCSDVSFDGLSGLSEDIEGLLPEPKVDFNPISPDDLSTIIGSIEEIKEELAGFKDLDPPEAVTHRKS